MPRRDHEPRTSSRARALRAHGAHPIATGSPPVPIRARGRPDAIGAAPDAEVGWMDETRGPEEFSARPAPRHVYYYQSVSSTQTQSACQFGTPTWPRRQAGNPRRKTRTAAPRTGRHRSWSRWVGSVTSPEADRYLMDTPTGRGAPQLRRSSRPQAAPLLQVASCRAGHSREQPRGVWYDARQRLAGGGQPLWLSVRTRPIPFVQQPQHLFRTRHHGVHSVRQCDVSGQQAASRSRSHIRVRNRRRHLVAQLTIRDAQGHHRATRQPDDLLGQAAVQEMR